MTKKATPEKIRSKLKPRRISKFVYNFRYSAKRSRGTA